MAEKIKSLGTVSSRFKEVRPETYTNSLIVLIIILTALASYGLGKLSALHSLKKPIVIENTVLPVTPPVQMQGVSAVSSVSKASIQTASVVNTFSEVWASKTGDKYHLPTCASAKTISVKNRVIFPSIEEARRAGYLPAGNCKGLK